MGFLSSFVNYFEISCGYFAIDLGYDILSIVFQGVLNMEKEN